MKLLIVSEGAHEEAALPVLVGRLVGVPFDWDFERVGSRKVRRHLRPGKSEEYEKRFLGWIDFAERHGYDAVVIVVDRDGARGRIEGANRAQGSERLTTRRAIGVAIRTFDAWMIADEKARAVVLGSPVDRPKAPERVRDPKGRAKACLESASSDLCQRDAYAEVAEIADLAALEERCPRGFRPFAERVRTLRG